MKKSELVFECQQVACRWKLTTEEFNQLIGAEITSEAEVAHDASIVTQTLKKQCALILEIDKCLRVLFPDEAADGWVKRSNSTFGGNTALQHMISGGEPALREVLNYLRAVIYT